MCTSVCVCACPRFDLCLCWFVIVWTRLFVCSATCVQRLQPKSGSEENHVSVVQNLCAKVATKIWIRRESYFCCAKGLKLKDIHLPLSHNTRSRMIIMQNLACAPLEISRVRSVAVRAAHWLHNYRNTLSDCSMLASVHMQIALLNISHAALEPVDGADQVEANFIALIVPPFGHGSKVCISARAHTFVLFKAHLGEPFLEI